MSINIETKLKSLFEREDFYIDINNTVDFIDSVSMLSDDKNYAQYIINIYNLLSLNTLEELDTTSLIVRRFEIFKHLQYIKVIASKITDEYIATVLIHLYNHFSKLMISISEIDESEIERLDKLKYEYLYEKSSLLDEYHKKVELNKKFYNNVSFLPRPKGLVMNFKRDFKQSNGPDEYYYGLEEEMNSDLEEIATNFKGIYSKVNKSSL